MRSLGWPQSNISDIYFFKRENLKNAMHRRKKKILCEDEGRDRVVFAQAKE